jgi:23S rRNA (guanosine2251-2'-O)-methyltransferase
MKNKILILNNIRSVLNVGAIFRTADAVGIDKIYLTGYTPAPIDRFGRHRQDFAKAALGAEKTVQWEQIDDGEDDADINLIEKLQSDGFKIVALELDEKSVDYKNLEFSDDEKVAVIVGNEVDGVSKNILNKVDVIAEIPMNGKKESLNVSVATGVLLYRVFDK